MFSTCISGITQAIASASKHIHSSAVLQAVKKTGALNKKINRTGRRGKTTPKKRPSVVLGTYPDEEEEKWKKCALASVLIDEKSLSSTPLKPEKFSVGMVNVPEHFGFGVDTAEKNMLLDSLPLLTADMAQGGEVTQLADVIQEKKAEADIFSRYMEHQKMQLDKANMFAKIIDLQNANAKGIAYVNRRRIIFAFSTPQKPFDTGRTEVQAALLTYKIRNLWKHLVNFKRDSGNRRNLRALVHERAKILRYLKRKSRVRYETLLEKLSLDPASVEGELEQNLNDVSCSNVQAQALSS